MNGKLRYVVVALLTVFALLQYRLWVGEGSVAEVRQLEQQNVDQESELNDLRERNEALRAEVDGLKQGMDAVEARARTELGMIREGETFYQVVPATDPNQGD